MIPIFSFGLWRKRQPQVFSHWYALFPEVESSTSEFYDAVGTELDKHQVPGLDTRRVTFTEGGILTSRRAYLRMQRERIVFDVCSAPFGTSWFFSCRIAEIPFTIRVWELLLLLAGLVGLFFVYPENFGIGWGIALFALTVIGGMVFLNRRASAYNHDLDSALMKIPILGALYELLLRRNQTYYREDTRAMYCNIVDTVVRAQVERVGAENGIGEVEFGSIDAPVAPRRHREKPVGVATRALGSPALSPLGR